MTIIEQRTMNAVCDIARSLRTIAECMMKAAASKEAEAVNEDETNLNKEK